MCKEVYMGYVIHYDIGAVVIMMVTLLIYTLKKKVQDRSSKLFSALLWCTLASTVFDIASVMCETDQIAGAMAVFFNTGHSLFHNAIPVLFLAYIAATTHFFAGKSRKIVYGVFFPWIVNALLICANPFLKIYFYIDEAGRYHRGSFLFIGYMISIYFLAFAVILSLQSLRNISRPMVIPVWSFIVVSAGAIAFQSFFPEYLVECFGISVCLMVIMFTMQTQSDVIEQETYMLNKTMFVRNLSAALKANEELSLLFIRIPDHKMILDMFGSLVRGRLRNKFSQYIYKLVKFGEAYYLDDECFVLVSKGNKDVARCLYEKISDRMEHSWEVDHTQIFASAYMLAITAPEDITDYETLDEYVNEFKSNDFTTRRLLSSKDLNVSNSQRRKEVERAIENSLENGGFWVCYQPIYDVAARKVNCCEALVRLTDEKLGDIYPDEFIPIAERNGSILDIGKLVFDTSCAFITDERAVELGIEFIHINLSVVQCMQPGLVEELTKSMDNYGVKPEQICLEITETASAFTPHIMEKNIQELSEKGIMLALDDFGTGYSNMNNLLRFPFRFVKFDKAIVWNSFETDKGRIAFESTIAMIQKLGMEIVAEGVEDRQQAQRLIENKCDHLQGYLLSKPVKQDAFFERVRQIGCLS